MSDSLRKEMNGRAGPGGVKCWCCGPGTRKADRAQFKRAAKRVDRRRARAEIEVAVEAECLCGECATCHCADYALDWATHSPITDGTED